MALRGTREEHAERAREFLRKARRHAEEALRLAEQRTCGRAFGEYESAVMYWGRYDAEVRWGGRVASKPEDEDFVLTRIQAARRSFASNCMGY